MRSWRLAAREIEDCVIIILVDALSSPARLLEQLWGQDIPGDQMRRLLGHAARLAATLRGPPAERDKTIRELIEQVIIDERSILIKLRRSALLRRNAPSDAAEEPSVGTIELTAVVDLRTRGAETKMALPGLAQQNQSPRCDPALIKAIARGRMWFEELATGSAQSLQQLAQRNGITRRYIRRLVDLSFLSPKLIDAILEGRQPIELTAARVTNLDLPLDWAEQHRLLVS
jgi:hypothetical protein